MFVVEAVMDVVDTAAVVVDCTDLTGKKRKEQVGVDGWSRDSLVHCRCRWSYRVHDDLDWEPETDRPYLQIHHHESVSHSLSHASLHSECHHSTNGRTP